jgi:hypothetical protein
MFEEASDVDLPDFDSPIRTRRSQPVPESEYESSGLDKVLGVIGRAINPPKADNAKPSEDFFDRGLGLLVKNSVFTLAAGLFFWELFLASPFFDRKLPRISMEEALVGAPIERAQPAASESGAGVKNEAAAGLFAP